MGRPQKVKMTSDLGCQDTFLHNPVRYVLSGPEGPSHLRKLAVSSQPPDWGDRKGH